MKTNIQKLIQLTAVAAALGTAQLAMAQTFTTMHSFANNDGFHSDSEVIVSGDTLYGTTQYGGPYGDSLHGGTVFSVKTNGSNFTILHGFSACFPGLAENSSSTLTNSDGSAPAGGLILSGDTLYGTTSGGGSAGSGTVFSVKTNGTGFTVLHNLNANGSYPNAHGTLLLLGNVLYGTTTGGGTSSGGTVFKVNTDGNNFTTLHNFVGSGGEGWGPYGGLILSGNTLYGTTSGGSAVIGGYTSAGTIFSVGTDGNNFTTLHSFPGGYYAAFPYCRLLLLGNALYGTTFGGGGTVNPGTIFSMDTSGNNFTTLHEFTGADGANPYAGLIMWHGILYGTTSCSDVGTPGTIFSVRTNGTDFTTLYSFTDGNDGKSPYGELTLSGNTVYGTTLNGGSGGDANGTVFSFTLPSPCAPAAMNIVLYAGISITGSIGCTYEIDYATNLNAPVTWFPLDTNTLTSSPYLYIDTNVVSGSRFYRAVAQ